MTNLANQSNPIQTRAYVLYTEIRELVRVQARLFLDLGQKLKRIRDEKLYRQIGEGGYESFSQFLNNPEIGLRTSTAYLYIRIYEFYIGRLGLSEGRVTEIPLNRLMRLLPALKQKSESEAKEIIERVGGLTNYDYDVEVKERKLESDRPKLYVDKESGKYVFEFISGEVDRIVETDPSGVRKEIYKCQN